MGRWIPPTPFRRKNGKNRPVLRVTHRPPNPRPTSWPASPKVVTRIRSTTGAYTPTRFFATTGRPVVPDWSADPTAIGPPRPDDRTANLGN